MAETAIISIQTGEAVKNVKELKDNIKTLKERLEDVSTSTDEYASITKELSQNQAALRNVMNGTSSTFAQSIASAQGLGTSYNSLVQQLKEATQEWRAIPKYLTDADKAQGVVNKAWTDAAAKVNTLRTELKNMDADTGSYVRNVGNYKSALDGFSGAMQNVKQVGGDMVNGISAAASSLAMLGINTDGLNDSMKNLRVILAAVQGAKGFAGMIKSLGSYFKAGKQATQATKQQTVATQQQAAAQTAANTATAQGVVQMGLLQKALIATGIGALVVALGMLVAHFEDVVKWVGKVGEKFGLWKMETDQITGSTDKLKEKIEQQNHALENEQKILSAQGVSNTTLLEQKKKLVQQQINDTKATIENVKARIAQLQADDRWWKFWQGTRGKIKKATEELEGLEEVLKNLNQIQTDIDVDIKVEGIKEGQKAAEQAKKDAEEVLKLAQQIVDKGIGEANKQLHAQETELEKIKREYKEQVDLIQSAITATEKLENQEANLKTLQEGLAATEKNYRKELSDYYKQEYEKKVAEQTEKIAVAKNAEYREQERIERVATNVLGMSELSIKKIVEATAARKREYDILKEQRDIIQKDIEPEVFELIPQLRALTPDEIRKEFAEPTATAIMVYMETDDKFQLAGEEMAKELYTAYEGEIERALQNGEFAKAEIIWAELSRQMREAFSGEKIGDLGGASAMYVKQILDSIEEAQAEYPLPQNGFLYDLFFGKDANLSNQLANIRAQAQKALEVYGEGSEQFIILNEQATLLSMKIWDNYFAKLGKHFQTYGKATTNVMDAVADCWEAALQAQVKNGKKSEEEAKRSFENIKKLQMASAIINTAGAVVQALADPTVPSYFVKIANAAAAGIAGAAQIIKIANTEFSSNAANATDSTPTLVDRTPQLQYTVGLNPQDYAEAQAERPIHCYITDRELDEGLEQYNRRRSETTF